MTKDSSLLFTLLLISLFFNIKKSAKSLPYLLFITTISYYNYGSLKSAISSLLGRKSISKTARIERVRHDAKIPYPGSSPVKNEMRSLKDYENITQVLQAIQPAVITPQSSIKTAQELLELIFDLKYWTLMQEKEGIEIYTLAFEGLELPMVRGEAYINGLKMEELMSVIQNSSARKTWDPRFDNSTCLKYLEDGLAIYHSTQKGTWPAAARDFVVVSGMITTPTKIVSLISSIPYDYPSEPSIVRGEILLGAWVLEKTAKGIRTSYIVSVDVKGSLPSALIKMVQVQTPLCIKRVKDYIEEKGSECYFEGTVVEKEIGEGELRIVLEKECIIWIPKRIGIIEIKGNCKVEAEDGEGLTKCKLKLTVENKTELLVEIKDGDGLDISQKGTSIQANADLSTEEK